MSIYTVIQRLEVGSLVDLYELDLNPIGVSQLFYFTPSDNNGQNVVYGGITYVPRAIEMAGFERSSEDQPPEPTLTISNVDKGGNALLNQYGDLVGVKVTRRRTFKQFLDFLDDGVTPNPTADTSARFLDEIWYIEQKVENSRILVQWRLKSVMDLDGIMVPRRRVLKNVCERRYRTWDPVGGSFIYSSVNACPYTGGNMYKRDGTKTVLGAEDECDKSYKGCVKRFPAKTDTLPGWFFPGAAALPGQ